MPSALVRHSGKGARRSRVSATVATSVFVLFVTSATSTLGPGVWRGEPPSRWDVVTLSTRNAREAIRNCSKAKSREQGEGKGPFPSEKVWAQRADWLRAQLTLSERRRENNRKKKPETRGGTRRDRAMPASHDTSSKRSRPWTQGQPQRKRGPPLASWTNSIQAVGSTIRSSRLNGIRSFSPSSSSFPTTLLWSRPPKWNMTQVGMPFES